MQILPKILIESFQSHGQYLCKFIETKESVCIRNSLTPKGLDWDTNMAAVTSCRSIVFSTNDVILSRGCKSRIASLRFAIQETKNDQKRQDTSRRISTEIKSKVKITATSTLTKQRSIQIFSYSQLLWRRRAFMMWCSFAPPIRRWLRSSFDARFANQQRKDGQKKQDKTTRIYTE